LGASLDSPGALVSFDEGAQTDSLAHRILSHGEVFVISEFYSFYIMKKDKNVSFQESAVNTNDIASGLMSFKGKLCFQLCNVLFVLYTILELPTFLLTKEPP